MGYGEFKRRLDIILAELKLKGATEADDDSYRNGAEDLAEKVVEIHIAMQKEAVKQAAKEKDSDYKRGYIDGINWMAE
jgi:hypothetical protein